MVGQKTRKNIYKDEVAPMLSHPQSETREVQDLGAYHNNYSGKKATITIDYTNGNINQGYRDTRILRGNLKIRNGDSESYDFFIKYVEKENAAGADHIKRCIAFITEAEEYGLDGDDVGITSPLFIRGPLDQYILSESAGKTLEELLKNTSVDDPNVICAIANNLFGVSKENLEAKFKDHPDFNAKKVRWLSQEQTIRRGKEYTGLFYKGLRRLFSQAIGKYDAAIKKLNELSDYLTDVSILVTDKNAIVAKINEEKKRGEIGVKDVKRLCDDPVYRESSNNFENLPIMFLPTDMYEHAYEHICIHNSGDDDNVCYEARSIDNALFENESSAGGALEAYEKLTNAAEVMEHLPKDMANISHLLKNIAYLVKEEFLKPDSPNKDFWDETTNIRLQALMDLWKASVKYKNTISQWCDETYHQIDVISPAQKKSRQTTIDSSGSINNPQ